jgi:hypothetical protein
MKSRQLVTYLKRLMCKLGRQRYAVWCESVCVPHVPGASVLAREWLTLLAILDEMAELEAALPVTPCYQEWLEDTVRGSVVCQVWRCEISSALAALTTSASGYVWGPARTAVVVPVQASVYSSVRNAVKRYV